jgi:cytidyltransferase-like protein
MRRPAVYVAGAFDNLRSAQIRFLEEASRLGPVIVLLWDDPLVQEITGAAPKFPFLERQYTMEGLRFVSDVRTLKPAGDVDALPAEVPPGSIFAMPESEASDSRRRAAEARGIEAVAIPQSMLQTIPQPPACPINPPATRKKVVATGCFDWLHSGHVRFFEELAALGDLYVIVGHDANIRLLKGEAHPLFPAAERVYMVGAFRHVTSALVSSGHGWLDGAPEFERLGPDMYAVNEDGDVPEKRKFCEEKGIEYRVLRRLPKPGLPRRASTTLRGF